METRANYVLIGAFTLAGLLGTFGLLLWLAKVDVDRQYAYYDVLFDNVSGLSTAGDVRYNGLPVGQVVSLEIDGDDPAKVRARIEVAAQTPIKSDTEAQLQSQGVTGVSFVSLTGGSPDAPPLAEDAVLVARRSALQTIFEGAPELLEKAITLLEDINQVVSPENRDAVGEVLNNLASASGRLDQVLTDFESLSDDLGLAAREVASFTGRLDALSATAETTLTTATETLTTANDAIRRAEGAIEAAVTTLETAEGAFATADGLMQQDIAEFVRQGTATAERLDSVVAALEPAAQATLDAAQSLAQTRIPTVLDDLSDAARQLDQQIATVGADASELIARYEQVGEAVQARVQQTESAIAEFEQATVSANATIESIRRTSDAAASFIETEGRPLAREATAAIGATRTLAEERLPALIDQANTTLATLDREAQVLSDSAQQVIVRATARLDEARETLIRLDGVLVQSGDTMVAVESASQSFSDLVEGEGAAMVADARIAAGDARAALATINASLETDLPALMDELRDTAQTANRVIDQVGQDVAAVSGRFDTLADDGSVALASATRTFANANETLAAVSAAMDSAQATLASADGAFASANRILDEEIDVIISDIRVAVSSFTTTLDTVTENVDTISAEILSASQSASNLVGTVDGIVQQNSRQVSEFLRVGLPQFQRFTEESRRLVVNLERLVDRVERDPARFLLGTQSSEFRR